MECPMDRIALGVALVVVPTCVLLYLGYRIVVAGLRLYRRGLVVESLVLFGTAIFAVGLAGIFASEKTLLVVGLLSWMVLAAALIRFVLRQGNYARPQMTRSSRGQEDPDPNSLNFSGAGPGCQGFGLYAGGVRIAHDPFEDD